MKDTEVKKAMLEMIAKHGAHGAILALADALKELGPAWQGEDGPAVGIEVVTGYAPWMPDDWRSSIQAEAH